MLIKYEFGLGMAQRSYPDSPARIVAEKATRIGSGYYLEVGSDPSMRIAWADNIDELQAFARIQGWHLEE